MRPNERIWISLLGLFLAAPVAAYEPQTHAVISRAAVGASRLGLDAAILRDLGIEPTQAFRNSKGDSASIADLVRDGARFEDDFGRSANHFYNPLTGQGVSGFSPSPNWAIDGEGDTSTTKFSFRAAREYMFNALTDSSESFRRRQFGLMFQSLGQVIHHIQDMAQPQHTRLDLHCDIFPCRLIGQFAPSLYEEYTNRDEIRDNLPFLGYAPTYSQDDAQTFNNARTFWHTLDGKGTADYSNRGFVSAGTNFDKPGLFPAPVFDPSSARDSTMEQLCAEEANRGRSCPGLTGTVTFYGSTVEDRYRPSTGAFNPRTSSHSLFDPDLTRAGRTPVFSLNRFNFYAAHDLLIPRAVGYSAGLINYYFRGKIDLVPDPSPPDNNPRYLIQNLGSEPMSGTFEVYYDAADGNRYPVRDASGQPLQFQTGVALAPGQNLPIAAFAAPTDPAPKLPLAYMLVFRGDMGEEKAGPGALGAIAAKFVTARAGLGLYLLGEDASGNTVTMKVDGKGLRVIRGLDATGAFIQNDQEFDPFQNGVPTQNPSRVVPQAHQMKQVTFQPLVTGDFSYNVVSVSVGDATAPVINGFVSPSTPLSYVLDSTQNRYLPMGSGVSWLATSPLGEFTFSLVPNFAADGGTLRFTRKFKDASGIEQMTTGEVVLPPLTFPISHGDYNGSQFGSLVVSGDGLKLSGLKPTSPVGDSSRIDNSSLLISLSDLPTLSLAGDGSTLHTLRENVTFRNTRTPQTITRNGTTLVLCTNIDSEAANTFLSSSEKFYVGYINNALQTYTRAIEDAKGGFQVETVECAVSVQDVPFPPPEDRQAVVGSVTTANARSDGNSARFGFSFQEGGLSFNNVTADDLTQTCSQQIALGALVYDSQTRLGFVGGIPVRNCTPSTVVRRDSITTLVRAITSKADHAVTTFQGERFPSPATLRFRGVDLGLREYVADGSPVGELFFATSDLSTVIHEPRTSGAMPKIQRSDIPANIVKLLAVIWL